MSGLTASQTCACSQETKSVRKFHISIYIVQNRYGFPRIMVKACTNICKSRENQLWR